MTSHPQYCNDLNDWLRTPRSLKILANNRYYSNRQYTTITDFRSEKFIGKELLNICSFYVNC